MQALQSIGTSVTRNLPGFIRQPAEALVGEKCYTSLVYNLNLGDVECIKHSLSKGLGLGMVLGGAILKLPQIAKIVASKSTRGLSLTAFILETLAYAITTAYSARNAFPFSQYGENAFLSLSNVIILVLFFWYGPGSRSRPDMPKVLACVVASLLTSAFLTSEALCPKGILATLQAATVPLTVLSKTPQIASNHRLRSTGNLSAFAVFNSFFGCAVRVFTTGQETGDSLVWWGYFLAAVCNAILVGQMVLYWRKSDVKGNGSDDISLEGGLGYPNRKKD